MSPEAGMTLVKGAIKDVRDQRKAAAAKAAAAKAAADPTSKIKKEQKDALKSRMPVVLNWAEKNRMPKAELDKKDTMTALKPYTFVAPDDLKDAISLGDAKALAQFVGRS